MRLTAYLFAAISLTLGTIAVKATSEMLNVATAVVEGAHDPDRARQGL
jgi:hypothetical protein